MATYNLRMRSSVKGKTTTVELPCSILPDTVRALKAEIEEQHSVPVQLQIISYNNGETLTDDLTLESIGVKTRDTLEVRSGRPEERFRKWSGMNAPHMR